MFDIEGRRQLYRRETQTENIAVSSMISNTLAARFMTHNFVIVVVWKNVDYSRSLRRSFVHVRLVFNSSNSEK